MNAVRTDYRYLSNRAAPWRLTSAGKFWLVYMAGINSAIGYVLVVGYWDAITAGLGL